MRNCQRRENAINHFNAKCNRFSSSKLHLSHFVQQLHLSQRLFCSSLSSSSSSVLLFLCWPHRNRSMAILKVQNVMPISLMVNRCNVCIRPTLDPEQTHAAAVVAANGFMMCARVRARANPFVIIQFTFIMLLQFKMQYYFVFNLH